MAFRRKKRFGKSRTRRSRFGRKLTGRKKRVRPEVVGFRM